MECSLTSASWCANMDLVLTVCRHLPINFQPLVLQGRHAAGEKIKELSRKQLLDVCASVENQVMHAVELLGQNTEPQSEEEQNAIIAMLVSLHVLRA